MPKIVDHQKQKEKVAQAVWQVILKSGIDKATVRNIAEEANLSVSTMRHYFTNQSELLYFSMNLIIERMEARIQSRVQQFDGSPLEAAQKIVLFFIPQNKEEQIELQVWLAFHAKALSDAKMIELSDKMYSDVYRGMEWALHILKESNLLKQDLDMELEIDRLYGLVDGLAIHRILKPDLLPPEKIRAIVFHHLKELCTKQC
ncbi:TetR/AcrR family transcriptional regulator [Shimazuella alba]|uniref:TetR family transcriptional regulator n=1 Tax=Shimazuella alba TaxID=2690964 RepID=A0A6I4VYV2_9BACL|nr:TetR family transcriptional regulator C-terminal domain-containing protein [Shimazuella alba]MXQ54926.1 TetR family transcriptional regulator [Shimazuella alba]